MKIYRSKKNGFTLIDLLVVISIIGVLISVSFVGFAQARKASRDSKRRADLEQIRSALEIYRNDCKTYPSFLAQGGTLMGAETLCQGNVYMQQIPQDPLGSGYNYSYNRTGPNSYVLCSFLETGGGGDVSGCGSCGSGVSCKNKVVNP